MSYIASYYPTRPPAVFYLDDDPLVVATLYMDRHLLEGVSNCLQLLSSVWCNAGHVEVAYKPSSLPGWSRSLDIEARLRGEQVYPPMSSWPRHAHIEWVGKQGGNYDWVWKLGMALVEEMSFRWTTMPKEGPMMRSLTAMLMTLEALPPQLEASRDFFSEAPYCLDPIFDRGAVVPSFEFFLAIGMRGIHGWSRRPKPAFIQPLWEAHPELHIAA